MTGMNIELTKKFKFDAAHALDCFPEGHKCRRLHGHTFRAEVTLAGEVPDGQAYLYDFGRIKQVLAPLIDALDHRYLNEIEQIGTPTAENLARWIYLQLKPQLPLLQQITVYESENNACAYRG